MNKLLYLVLIIVASCTVKNKAPIKAHISIMNRVDSVDLGFEVWHGNFYSVKLDLTNNTDSIYYIWTNSCSWQSNWVFQTKTFSFAVACPKNIPELVKLPSKETRTYHGFIQFSDTIDFKGIKKDRLGFVLVKENEVETDADFIPVLWSKIKKKKDIYWTNLFEIRK
jgi:hypothetical protein